MQQYFRAWTGSAKPQMAHTKGQIIDDSVKFVVQGI